MKLINGVVYCFAKVCTFLVSVYMHIVYRPKAHYVDKKVQTNRLKTPCIVIANHTSLKDPPFILSILKGKKAIVVAKDWFEKPSINWIIKPVPGIPCDRYNLDTEWSNQAKNYLRKGYSVIIFPEGKIRTDGELNEFKSGFAFLARYTGFPVVSIGMDGNYKFGHRIHYVVDVPETVTRTKGIPSSQDLALKSEYFRQKVISLKKAAINKTNKVDL